MVKKGPRVSEAFLQLKGLLLRRLNQFLKRGLQSLPQYGSGSLAVTVQYDCSGNLEEMTNGGKGSVSSRHEHKVSFMTYSDRSARPWI